MTAGAFRADERTVRNVERAIDPAFLRHVVAELSSIGAGPLGFRVSGTPEDKQAATLVTEELRRAGLEGTGLEPVPVDGWQFRAGSLDTAARLIDCAAFGGS